VPAEAHGATFDTEHRLNHVTTGTAGSASPPAASRPGAREDELSGRELMRNGSRKSQAPRCGVSARLAVVGAGEGVYRLFEQT
jgi:hypothetical protein